WSGHDSVQDFAEAGGLDTLFIESQKDDKDQTLRIAAPDDTAPPVTGHLFSIPWAESTAMMLVTMESHTPAHSNAAAAPAPVRPVVDAPPPAQPPAQLNWHTIVEVASDAVVTFNRDGQILTANAGAERLF